MAARLLALGMLVLVLSACGAEAVPPGAVAAPDTARVETVTRVSMGDGSGTHELRSTTLVDFERDRREDVDVTNGCRTITVGDVYYVEVPLDGGLPEGKRWVKNDLDVDSEALFEQSQEQRTSEDGTVIWRTIVGISMAEPHPDEYLKYLRERSGDPERVGEEDVRGMPTTHYRAKLDVREGIRRDLEADGWKPANVDRYLEQVGGGDEVVDVWVGDDGLVRRVLTVTTNESGAGGSFESVTTSDYLDYGLEAEIEAPPAAEVLDQKAWERISEEQWLEENKIVGEVGLEPLPGAFEPSVAPSCLH